MSRHEPRQQLALEFGATDIVTVGFAYMYVWRRGGLDWN